jgi:ABC-type multidrug transport system fused ATPase/permease subunit
MIAYVMGVAEKYLFQHLGADRTKRIKAQLMSHIALLPLSTHAKMHTSSFASLMINDVATAGRFYDTILREMVYSVSRLVAIVVILLYVYHALGLFALLIAPVYILISRIFLPMIHDRATLLHEHLKHVSHVMQECLAGARDLKTLGAESLLVDRFKSAVGTATTTSLQLRAAQASSSLTYIVFWTVACALYYMAGRQVLNGRMTLGLLTALISYANLIQEPFARFAGLAGEWPPIRVACRRLNECFSIASEKTNDGLTVDRSSVRGAIEFRNVSKSYDDTGFALSDISFTIQPNQKVAVVGASGAGKTTLISLLPLLHRPSSGSILLDGRDLNSYSLQSLWRLFGVVFQEPFLFDLSIRDNLLLGGPNATDYEVEQAARAANIHDFICALPNGYDTQVGERGFTLSAGQKQRIGIARVLVQNPRILILDEATASLDPQTEHLVHLAIQRIMRDRTCVIIAHRLSTIVAADNILVLGNGRLLGSGKHEVLLATCPAYRTQYRIYTENPGAYMTEAVLKGVTA